MTDDTQRNVLVLVQFKLFYSKTSLLLPFSFFNANIFDVIRELDNVQNLHWDMYCTVRTDMNVSCY